MHHTLMKSFTIKVLFAFSLAAIILSCKKEDNQGFSFESIRGDSFQFHSSITSIAVGKDSSIILGTDRGIIASFNPDNGLFTELESHDCGTIYDIYPYQGKIFYSVQDGGVRCGDTEVLRVEDKGIQYSPYNICFDKKGALLAATSNGAYRWETITSSTKLSFAKPVMKREKAAPMRIFDIETGDDGSVIFAGDTGVFKIRGGDTTRIFQQPVVSMHNGYFLTKDGGLYKVSAPYDKVTQFENNPLAFQLADTFVYASSLNGVEIADTNGIYRRKVLFPNKNPQRIKNESLRNICITHGQYLYMTSGDESLYRIPLGLHEPSERIISICDNKRGVIYALSSNNDLYELRKNRKRFSYVRSFSVEDRVKLLNSFGDTLIVSYSGIPYYYVGAFKTVSSRGFYNTELTNKVTCRFFPSSNTLYEGRIDCIREYSPTSPQGRSLDVSSVFSGEGTLDYYPTFIEKVKDRLVFATLHSGVYAETADKKFVSLIDSSEHVKAISGVDSLAFVLTTDRLYRFKINEQSFDMPDVWSTKVLGSNAKYLNGMVSTADSLIYLYSNDYRFCRGIYKCELSSNGEINSICLSNTSGISDALPLNGQEVVFSGSMGIESSDKSIQEFFNAPSWLAKVHAKTFPWGYFVVLLFGLAIYGITRVILMWYDTIQIKQVEKHGKNTFQEYQEAISKAHTVLTEKMITRRGKKRLDYLINEWCAKHDELFINEEVLIKKPETIQQYDGVIAVAENIEKGLFTSEAKNRLTTVIAQLKEEHDNLVIKGIKNHHAETVEECSFVLSEAKVALDALFTTSARMELLSCRKQLKKQHDEMLLNQINYGGVSSVRQCDEIIEKLEAAQSSQLITNEYSDKARRIIKDMTKRRVGLLAEEQKNRETAFEIAWGKATSEFCTCYRSDYIGILLETQKDELKKQGHNLDPSAADILFQRLSQECDVAFGEDKVNRLELLDKIGVLVAETVSIVRNPRNVNVSEQLCSLCDKYLSSQERSREMKELGFIDSQYCPNYHEIDDYDKYIEQYEALNQFQKDNARESQTPESKVVKKVELVSSRLSKEQIDFIRALYKQLFGAMTRLYSHYVELFFRSYLNEDVHDPLFEHLFPEDSKQGGHWQASFLFIPVCSEYNDVGNVLIKTTAMHTRKNEWKNILSVEMGDSEPSPAYPGLIGLIAKTISRKLKIDNRTRSKPL